MTPPLEAVYYPRATPLSHETLTFMALAFERVHFPGFYVPGGDFDREKLRQILKEAREAPGEKPPDYARVMNGMIFALNRDDLRQFCVFADKPEGLDGEEEQRARTLGLDIIRAIGEEPPVALRGKLVHWTEIHLQNGVMRYPSAFEYPANALLYAQARGIPVLNDDPGMPVPAVHQAMGSAGLSAVLAAECLRLALPVVPMLSIPQIIEVRHELQGPLAAFRNAMVRLSKDLDARVRGGDETRSVQEHARFVIETSVAPTISELEAAMTRPAQPWLRRAVEMAKLVPDLALAFTTLSPAAAAKVLGELSGLLISVKESQDKSIAEAKRTGLYYLLRLRERMRNNVG